MPVAVCFSSWALGSAAAGPCKSSALSLKHENARKICWQGSGTLGNSSERLQSWKQLTCSITDAEVWRYVRHHVPSFALYLLYITYISQTSALPHSSLSLFRERSLLTHSLCSLSRISDHPCHPPLCYFQSHYNLLRALHWNYTQFSRHSAWKYYRLACWCFLFCSSSPK